jgi:hypothetical protein
MRVASCIVIEVSITAELDFSSSTDLARMPSIKSLISFTRAKVSWMPPKLNGYSSPVNISPCV